MKMSYKENDELSNLIAEQKKAVSTEADLLSKIYGWFNNIQNISAATKIDHEDIKQIFNMTSENAKAIESKTGLTGLSDLVIARNKILEEISKQDRNLSKLWSNIINDLSKQ